MIQATVPPSHLALTEADPGAPGQTQEQSLVDDSHTEVEIKPQLKHRDSMAKEEDPNASHQLYKWQVKPRRSTGLTLCPMGCIQGQRKLPQKKTNWLWHLEVDIGGKNTQQ